MRTDHNSDRGRMAAEQRTPTVKEVRGVSFLLSLIFSFYTPLLYRCGSILLLEPLLELLLLVCEPSTERILSSPLIVLLYPIDLVKVRYQVYDRSGNAYTSLKDAFRTIIREEGFSGLYQVRMRFRNM